MFKVGDRVRARERDNPTRDVASALPAEASRVGAEGVVDWILTAANYSHEDGFYAVKFPCGRDLVSGVYLDLVEPAAPTPAAPTPAAPTPAAPTPAAPTPAAPTLTLRDQFAMAAMAYIERSRGVEVQAHEAYRLADAMLAARDQKAGAA